MTNPVISLMTYSWQQTKKADDARLAKQKEPEGITQINNIPYIDDGNVYHRLDVYYPEGTQTKLPVIIDIHGGGWMYGDKELNKIYCLNLAKRGFTVFNISYRLVPDVTVNEQLQDCALALRWISEHLDGYPCDKENIMLTGDSAGGQLSSYSAALLSSPCLREVFDVVDGNLSLTALLLTSPVPYMKDAGAMSVYTRIMWGEDYMKKATYNYMDLSEIIDFAEYPPTIMTTSSGDFLARAQTRKAAELFRSKGIETKLMDFEKFNGKHLDHVFPVLEPESEAGSFAIDAAIRFFRDHMKATEKAGETV